jgi:hypothetical protein
VAIQEKLVNFPEHNEKINFQNLLLSIHHKHTELQNDHLRLIKLGQAEAYLWRVQQGVKEILPVIQKCIV